MSEESKDNLTGDRNVKKALHEALEILNSVKTEEIRWGFTLAALVKSKDQLYAAEKNIDEIIRSSKKRELPE